MADIVNRQRKIDLNENELSLFADMAVRNTVEAKNRLPVIALVDDEEMKRLNTEFRQMETTTDVLSFRYLEEAFEAPETLGDIVISVPQAQRQAIENDLDVMDELRQLILHGILHLCGYDHDTDEGEMDRREIELRKVLEINY
ncbi:MAG: rRNA maturation RNase YbeY [Pyrinomonadaceae bacterium]|nr:rRNA maturation RNase YbeY [Pyrinomonadaceae bacterium]